MPSIGKTALSETSNSLFLIDESLDWNVAKALRLVKYSTTTVYEAFPGKSGVKDPEIIAWCENNDATWVHADDRARKEHRKEIAAARIRFLWVYRPGGVMSSKEQLRVLSYVLLDVMDRFEKKPRQLHYKVSAHGEAPRKRIRLEPLSLVL